MNTRIEKETKMIKAFKIVAMSIVFVLGASLSMSLAGNVANKRHAFCGSVVGEARMQAVVQAVNYATREVTVRNSKGKLTTVVAGPMVRNFNQIKKDDKVLVQFRERVTILDVSGSKAVPSRNEVVDVAGAPLGQKPAGTIVKTSEVIADVVAINHKARTITLKGPKRTVIVLVDKKVKNFDRIRSGDKIFLRFTKAVAISVIAQ
jgi:hypothetical protein